MSSGSNAAGRPPPLTASSSYTPRPPLVDLITATARMVAPGKLALKDFINSLPPAGKRPPALVNNHHHSGPGENNDECRSRAVLVRHMRDLVESLQEVLQDVDDGVSYQQLQDQELPLKQKPAPPRQPLLLETHSFETSSISTRGQHKPPEETEPAAARCGKLQQRLLLPSLPAQQAASWSPAVDLVLSNSSLLSEVFSFLVSAPHSTAHPHAAKVQLCALNAVSRAWQEASQSDHYWSPIAIGLFPVLAARPPPTSCGPREYVRDYGRCLVQRAVQDGDNWQASMLLSFEVYDEWDGARLFSALGPVELILSSESGLTAIRLTGTKRSEASRPFTAASRDPEQQRFGCMRDFFTQASEPRFASSLCVRVVAIDANTGKKALLYQSGKKTQRSSKVSSLAYWQQWLTPGSLFIWEPWSRWSVGSGMQELVEISTSFYVSPVPGLEQQEGVAEPLRQYAVMGGDSACYAEHNSFVALQFRTLDAGVPGRFFRAALANSSAAAGNPLADGR